MKSIIKWDTHKTFCESFLKKKVLSTFQMTIRIFRYHKIVAKKKKKNHPDIIVTDGMVEKKKLRGDFNKKHFA